MLPFLSQIIPRTSRKLTDVDGTTAVAPSFDGVGLHRVDGVLMHLLAMPLPLGETGNRPATEPGGWYGARPVDATEPNAESPAFIASLTPPAAAESE